MASTDIRPDNDQRNVAYRHATILFFILFLSMCCTPASAYTYNGEIASISTSPSTIHGGDSITHSVTVINTGDDGLPVRVQVSGGDDATQTFSNIIVPVSQTVIITLFTTAPAVDSGQISFTYRLYWDKPSPLSDQLLDTETRSVTINQSASSTGSLYCTSDPSGANIYIDGSYRGTTPVTLSGLSPGSHTLRISESGYTDYTATITVYAGQTTTVSRTLTPSSQTGSISISSSPPGADVYIDGSYRGITPVTLSGLATGSHTLRISESGYTDYSTRVTVYSGETAIVSRTLTSGQTGSLSISSSPPGSDVYIDGSYRGITPVTFSDLTTGSHTIRISQWGYNDYSTKVTVYSGETATVSRTLSPSSASGQTGSLSISSSPSRASVYLDGSYQGITPVILSDLTTGSHTIRISQSGYNDYSATATVYSWQTTTVTGILSPITPIPTTSPAPAVPATPVPQTTGSFDPLSLIIVLIIGVFVVVAGYFGYSWIMRSRAEKPSSPHDDPVRILKMRYAQGELTTEEYLQVLENLKK